MLLLCYVNKSPGSLCFCSKIELQALSAWVWPCCFVTGFFDSGCRWPTNHLGFLGSRLCRWKEYWQSSGPMPPISKWRNRIQRSHGPMNRASGVGQPEFCLQSSSLFILGFSFLHAHMATHLQPIFCLISSRPSFRYLSTLQVPWCPLILNAYFAPANLFPVHNIDLLFSGPLSPLFPLPRIPCPPDLTIKGPAIFRVTPNGTPSCILP